MNAEFKELARERPVGDHGVRNERQGGGGRDGGDAPALEGVEERENVNSEQVAGAGR